MEISLQASLAKGCPPLISCSDFDTQGPSRFEDEYLTADPADVPYESNDVNRRNLIANALRLTFPVRLKVVKLLNDLESGGGTYEDALKLDVEVLDVIMHRYLSSLHMPFFGISLHESAYAFSRKIVIDTAIKIWCATWPSTSINSADIPGTSTTANENNLFPRFVLNGSGFFRTVAVQAACVISAELIAQLQEDQGLSPTPLRRDLLSVMEEAKTWHLRSIQSGETSAKGHLLATLMAAQLEGLRKGLDRGQLGRFLVEATERSGEISLPILEGLERTTRAGHQGVNGTGPPVFEERSDILPGLTGEWDFTMPDAIFTDSDGSPDWSFGVGTMQGLSFW
ncbi:hypothetical protein SLS53_006901 [Cytospora paraplurivora]|uniref:Uncharacterized protein n=1 Tax=Cytospora paraplurivora TaxID=2898453 RepID=A0AAN9YEB5_9PEZI